MIIFHIFDAEYYECIIAKNDREKSYKNLFDVQYSC